MTTIVKPNSKKQVNISKNSDSYIANYVQLTGHDFFGQQVLETKFFANEKNAIRWANKILNN